MKERKISSRWKDSNGYVVVRIGGKSILEHRHIMAGILGRELSSKEIVHHINGDQADNRPENLEVMTRAEHVRLHRPGKNLRPLGVPNELVPCACGCGEMIWRWDKRNRERRYANRHGQRGKHYNCGEACGQAKLTRPQVLEIRRMQEQQVMSQSAMGRMFGVAQNTISAIIHRTTWKHLEGEQNEGL